MRLKVGAILYKRNCVNNLSLIVNWLVQEIQSERDHSHQDKRMKECCIEDTGF